jgi:hypothetical protein
VFKSLVHIKFSEKKLGYAGTKINTVKINSNKPQIYANLNLSSESLIL